MATILDISILKNMSIVFTFLFVLFSTLAVLHFTKLFGDKVHEGVYIIIALSLAFLTLIFPPVTQIITSMAPWFVLLMVFIIFVLIGMKMFGIADSDIKDTVLKQAGIKWAIFIVILIILVVAWGGVSGQGLLQNSGQTLSNSTAIGSTNTATGDFQSNVQAVFFHPKMLGVMFVILLAAAAVGMLGGKPSA